MRLRNASMVTTSSYNELLQLDVAMSPNEELTRRLDRLPKGAISYFGDGFAVASILPEEVRNKVLELVIDKFRKGSRHLEGSVLRPLTGLSLNDADQLASAYSVTIGLLSEVTATSDEFVSTAINILFRPEQTDVARSIAVAVGAHRQEIKTAVQRAQLSNETLPSFSSLDTTVDLRIRVVDGKIGLPPLL